MKKAIPKYRGTEEQFILVTGIICQSCLAHISSFSAHKPKYTPAFVQEIIRRCRTISQIPNLAQRQSTSAALRTGVVRTGKDCCDNYLALASYIDSSFPGNEVEDKKKLAGATFLDAARRSHWSSVTALNNLMLTFIEMYEAELTKEGMPSGFPAECATDSQSFSEALQAFETAKETACQQAQSRVQGFNGVYQILKEMMKDGKLIFRKNKALCKQFTYRTILAKVRKKSGQDIPVASPVNLTGQLTQTVSLKEVI